jgi:hypothetical protein
LGTVQLLSFGTICFWVWQNGVWGNFQCSLFRAFSYRKKLIL